jgi:hypothetical protein
MSAPHNDQRSLRDLERSFSLSTRPRTWSGVAARSPLRLNSRLTSHGGSGTSQVGRIMTVPALPCIDTVPFWRDPSSAIKPDEVVAMNLELGDDGMVNHVTLADWNAFILMNSDVVANHTEDADAEGNSSPTALSKEECRLRVKAWLAEKPILVGRNLQVQLQALNLSHDDSCLRDSERFSGSTRTGVGRFGQCQGSVEKARAELRHYVTNKEAWDAHVLRGNQQA